MKSQVKSVVLSLRQLRLRSLAIGSSVIIIPIIVLISLNQFIANKAGDSPEDSGIQPVNGGLVEVPSALTELSEVAVAAPESAPMSAPSASNNALGEGKALPDSSALPAWQQTVQEEIRQAEYHITWQEDVPFLDEAAAYQAPNREHNFRTYFIPEGIHLQPRTETTATWQWGLELTGFGYANDIQPVATAELIPDENRIAYQRNDITEWYINGEMGLEQGFTLQRPPAPKNDRVGADSLLILELAVAGTLTPQLVDDGAAIDFNTPNGTRVLRYSKLAAFDANGQSLPAHMQLSDCTEPDLSSSCQLQLAVNDSHATYPIVMDPIASDPDWSESGGQIDAEFGSDVAGGGDVNGDGFDDVIISAPYYDNGQADEGRVFVYYGSAAGLSLTADWTMESNQANAHFGTAVATAGDINTDGYADILIGAPDYDNGETDEGSVFIYFGSASGLSQMADWTAESDQAGARFGHDVGSAGDVDNNGYDDVIVGAPDYDNDQSDEGRVFVYTNSSAGLSSTPWTAESDKANSDYGYAVSTAGDVNGDGYADIIVGAPEYKEDWYGEGRVYVYLGSSSGLNNTPWMAHGDQAGGGLGTAVGIAGDVNGDGYDEVVMGADYYDVVTNNDGQVYLYYGSAGGLGSVPDWTVSGPSGYQALMGAAVNTGGDINGDGYDDLLIGVPRYKNGSFGEGAVFVYYGQSAGLAATADWIGEGNSFDARMGNAVAAAGDINGDGYDDIIVGAYWYDDEGTAFSYYGSADGFTTYADWTAEGEQRDAYFGDAVSNAGDVNGDGYDDVIIGAYFYDNGQSNEGRVFVYHGSNIGMSGTAAWTAEGDQTDAFFGQAVAAAGDIDGDGYDDIIIGSAYDNGQTDEGRIHVYYGSSTGLDTASLWTAESDQAGALLGDAVGGAGDVNNDGYDDIIAGAPYYDNGQSDEGQVFVYYGAAGGLTPGQAADWTAEGDVDGARFGNAVDTAGDVNGDGYADVIIGAYRYSNGGGNNGRVFIYHGSSSGLGVPTQPDWTAISDVAGWYFGNVVGDAGDVNGDGFGDIIIGHYKYTNEEFWEGRALVYHGGANGLSDPLQPDWAADECDQAHCKFGTDAGAAGDFNGDGYDDVIVGAPFYSNGSHWEGAAYVYFGSTTGLSVVSDWLVETDKAEARLGSAVSAAGNVNGDAYDDVLVGSPYYEHGDYKEGIAAIFFGPGDSGNWPIADFSASPLSGIVPLSVVFTNLSQNGVSYFWEFGDGTTSTLVSPTHTYTQTGVYTVTLTAYGSVGLPSVRERANYINVTEPITPTSTPTPTPTNTATATSTPTPMPTSSPTPLPTTETLIITPTQKTVVVGDIFTVTVGAANILTPISAYQFDVSYDNNLLRLEKVEGGDFFATDGQDTVCPPWVEPAVNSMRLACVGVGPNVGSTGNGRLATLTFTALTAGNSDLILSGAQLADTSVPPTAVNAALVDGRVTISSGSANAPFAVASTDNNSGNGSLFATGQLTWVENTDGFLLLFAILSFFVISGVYLHRRGQLNYIWRLLMVASMLLQTLVIMPPVTHAVSSEDASESNANIHPNNELRSTANLAPPVSPAAITSLGCYDADLECDKDVDEADVTQASFSWDCSQGVACYDIDADIDDNNIVDAFDLAWVTNDYDIAPPDINIISPDENAVVTGANFTVSGLLTDTHAITQVTVNGVAATIVDNTFNVQLPVETGNFVLDVMAEDEVGLMGFAGRVVTADQDGPMVKIESPPGGQAVYTTTPTVTVSYVDFLSNVDANSFSAEVQDDLGNTVQTIGNSVAGSDWAQFTLAPLALDQSYTLIVTVADEHGNISITSNSFYVTPDTGIVPPVVPTSPGWISGRIYDSSTCNQHLTVCQGLAGAQVTLMQVDPDALEEARANRVNEYEALGQLDGAFPAGDAAIVDTFSTPVTGTLLTGPDGFYAFPVDATGIYHLRVEKAGFTYGQREARVVRERSTAVNEIYLTPLDSTMTLCGDTGCSHTSADGQMMVEIPAGAIPAGEQVEVTATEFDRVNFLPSGSLPPGTAETYAFNLGGSSDYTFQQPITVSVRNSHGFAPGTNVPLGYWNQHTQQWEHSSYGLVDDTGTWMVMQVTHFSNFDCNDPVVSPDLESNWDNWTEEDNACSDGEEGCFINLKSGTLREWVELPSVNVVGQPEAPTLAYSTNRAKPSEVIDIQLDLLFDPVLVQLEDHIRFELYIEGAKTDTVTIAANALGDGEVGRYRYLWDGRNAIGELLPPGIYEYAVRLSVPYQGQWHWTLNGRFGGPPDPNRPTGVFTTGFVDEWAYGTITLNSQPGASYGSGWVLQNQQFIYEDEVGGILVAAGDELTEYYSDANNKLSALFHEDLFNLRYQYGYRDDDTQPPVVGPASATPLVATPSGGTLVSGVINFDTTWTLAESPYIILDGDVTVANGATLTVDPGVQVLLSHDRNLIIEGGLDALGTVTDPIALTAYYDENTYSGNTEESEVFTFSNDYSDFQNVQAIAVDQAGETWVAGSAFGEYGGNVLGLQRLHRDLQTRDTIYPPYTFYGSQVRNITVDNSSRKWFATDQGILMLDADDVNWTHYTQFDSALNADDVRAVAVDADNNVWFALYGSGIQSLSADGVTWTAYDTSNSGLPSDAAYDVAFDSQGNLWIGTGNGLSQYNPATDSWTTYDLDAGWPNVIERLSIDQDNNVWITVPSTGIRMLSSADATWTSYTTSEGLKSNNVVTIAVDNLDRKWVGYDNNGVSVLSSDNTTWDDKGGIVTVNDIAVSSVTSDVWLALENGEATRNYITGFFYDGTIVGGHWGTVQINGSANLNYVTLEMGGVYQQSALKFQDAAPSSLSNVAVRNNGGHGIEVGNSAVTLTNFLSLSNEGDGLYLGHNSVLTLTNSIVQQNKRDGIFLDASASVNGSDITIAYNDAAIYTADSSANVSFTNITITGNNSNIRLPAGAIINQLAWQDNRRNDIEWVGGAILIDRTWLHVAGMEQHIVLEDIEVMPSGSLSIPAGIEILFADDVGLTVAGSLTSVGDPGNPIYLGAFSNQWAGIVVSGPTADLQETVIQDAAIGIMADGAAVSMSHMTIADNDVGVQVNNNAAVAITLSNLAYNNILAIENTAGPGFVVDARNNYWGHSSGPSHTSNPGGMGDAVSDNVDFALWRPPILLDNPAIFVDSLTATDTSQLSYDSVNDTYVRHYADGRSVHFDTQGRHDYTEYPDGRILAYTYNPDGTTATMEVTAPGQTSPNAVWTFNYAGGKLDSITDPLGRVIDFTVDDNNQLRQVDIPGMGSRQFYYNQDNLLTQQVDEAGSVTSYGYDVYGRIATHTDPTRAVYDPQTGQTTFEGELRHFTTSDTGYDLINVSAVGDPDNPAPAVPTSADLNEQVSYGIGGRATQTNEWGHITQQTDALNRTMHLQRDEANRVTRVDLPNGDCIEADYDEMGNVLSAARLPAAQCALEPDDRDPGQAQTSARTYEPRFNQPKIVTNPAGEQIVYYYDYELGQGDAGRVVRIDYPAIPDEYGVMTTPSVAYSYNSLGLVETETDVRGTVTRYVYTQGTPDEADGGANPLFAPGVTPVPGRITQVIEDDGGFGYTTTYKDFDALGNPQTIIFPGGHQTSSTYDNLGRLVTDTNVIGIVTRYEYDDRGNVLRKVADYTADGVTGDNVVTTYEYDSDGRLLHERTAADGLVIESYSRYDINGRLVSQSDGQGNETRYIYDDAGQLIETIDAANHSTTYTYNDAGLPETVTDAEGHTTRTIYDDFGRVYQTIQAEGELDLTTTYTYTVDNLVTASEAPDGVVTCFEYDSLHRRTKTIQDCGPDGLNLTTSYAYDIAGNTVFVTDTRGIVTYTEYDALGRVTLTRQDDGGLNYETTTAYHPVTGNLDTTVSVDGTVTQYHYDAYNRLEQVCQDSAGLNLCTSYTYDHRGRQETVTDAEGIVQQTVYNSLGLSVQEIADVNGLAATISYEYDDLLNLIQVADANGNVTQYSYTPRQEMAAELYADGTSVSYAYDPRGSLATMTLQDSAVITHTYDAANRQTRLDFSTGGFQSFAYDTASRMTSATQTMDGHTTITGYGYDSVGSVVTTTQQLDGGAAWLTQYAYDYAAGERTVTYPSGAVRTYATDNLNRLDTVAEGGGAIIADYGYDVINRFNSVAYPANGLTNRQDYDPLGRITQVTVNDGVNNIVDYGYGYDNVGNRTYMQRNHRPNQPADVYEYDDLYQLVNLWYGADATTPGAITSYTSTQGYDLDDLGNRLTVTEDGATENYGPNDGTQLTNVMNRYESVEGAALGYDVRGNTLTDGDGVYVYDILNRQTSVTNGNGTTEYIYDARGRRVAKVNGGVTTHFIYDTQYRVIEERDDSETLIASYTYGQGMDEPLTMERGGQTYYYHRDALGSVTEVSDATGAIVERYEYDVYGAVTIYDGQDNVLTASGIDNPYLFTGRRYDAESDNYYYRARYYSHSLGRFLSQDPLGFDAGDYNLYRYVFNNPTNAVDPTGELAWFIPWLLKATVEAGVDALMQATVNYFIDPNITTVGEAFGSIDWKQVAWAGATGLLPGGGLGKAAIVAVGDVVIAYLNAVSKCESFTPEQALLTFGFGIAGELIGEGIGKLVAKYGTPAVAAGLKKLGMDEAAEKLLRQADEVVDDAVPKPRPKCSFSEETLVATEDGYIPISDVEIGDYVLAYNEVTGEIGYYPVTATWVHEDPVIVYLTIDGETIETTPEHPFYTTDGEWIPAGELHANSEVYKANGSYGTVENVAFVYQLQPMYNLTVATAHTYFVGEEQWLVHNDCEEAAIKKITDTFQKADGDCLRCAAILDDTFKGKGQVYLIRTGTERELFGTFGENIGAPMGWHVVWVRNKTKTVYDNAGNQGAMGTYFNKMFIHNGPDLLIEPRTIEEIMAMLE